MSIQKIRPNTKLARILEIFINGGSLNRFEATKRHHDWCLHSTVSSIQKYGVRIDRKTESVRNFLGKHTHCCRYWLTDDEKPKARKLLGL